MHASMPDPADIRACRAALRAGSSSFHTASLLLPRRVRDHASALYAFCRVADDVADNGGRREHIDGLRQRLDAVYAGRPRSDPIDRAFAAVVAAHGVPRALPDALIEGLAWDVEGRTYDTLSDLEAYAARVAGSVGAMMTLVMGVRDPVALARACDLGVAMQLTNIARDIGEDARMGRVYIPRQWLCEAGVDAKAFSEGLSPEFKSVVMRLLAVADALYRRSAAGIAQLPFACRTGIHAARLIYADIGTVVRRAHFDPVAERAVVRTRRKLALVGRAALQAAGQVMTPAVASAGEPALESTAFLVAAALASRPAQEPIADGGRVVWLLDLFERLERRKEQEGGQAWSRVLSP